MTDLKKLAEDIAVSYEARVRIVKGIAEDTKRTLENFRERREKMASELREVLSKSENLRKKDFNAMMEKILLTQAERENNVKQILANFREEEEAVSEQLKKLLQRGEKIQIKDFKKVVVHIQQEQEERQKEAGEKAAEELRAMQSEVGNMLERFREEREKISFEWGNIITAMREIKQKSNT